MSHNHHPAIRQHGLQDDCPRCTEQAADPFAGLDDDNLLLLMIRTRAWMRDEQYSRSENELTAMRVMEQALRRMDQLDRILEQQQRDEDGPSDDDIYNRVTGPFTGVEGGIAYDTTADQPGSLGENDWRL